MSAKHINRLMHNPFLGSEIITHFLSGFYELEEEKNSFSTPHIYLVLPFVLSEPIREVLQNCSRRSNVFTIFLKNSERSSSLGGVEEQYKSFLPLTRKALIVGHNRKDFKVSDTITLLNPKDYRRSEKSAKTYFHSAFYLGYIFKKEASLVEVYEKLIL